MVILLRHALVPVVIASALLACGGGAADTVDSGVSTGVSPGCPDAGTAFSYTNDVVPVLDQACLPCHGPGGIGGYDESTYARVLAQRSPMLDQISSSAMPPINGPVLTAAQRFALTQWLECGAPDN